MFKTVNGLTPNYISDSVTMTSDIHDLDTRLSRSNDVHIPLHNYAMLKWSFRLNGGEVLNNLPDGLKVVHNLLDLWKVYTTCC